MFQNDTPTSANKNKSISVSKADNYFRNTNHNGTSMGNDGRNPFDSAAAIESGYSTGSTVNVNNTNSDPPSVDQNEGPSSIQTAHNYKKDVSSPEQGQMGAGGGWRFDKSNYSNQSHGQNSG